MTRQETGSINLRDAEGRRKADFIALFNALWYRDFPFIPGHEPESRRAMYTAHLNSVVKGCADLMGFFTLFEEGSRTDVIIRKATGRPWAKIELEWVTPRHTIKVNEIQKLLTAAKENQADNFIFVGHSNKKYVDEDIKTIQKQWISETRHLLAFLIVGKPVGKQRHLLTLRTYRVQSGRATMLREQHAYPWDVPNTRWRAGFAAGVHNLREAQQTPPNQIISNPATTKRI